MGSKRRAEMCRLVPALFLAVTLAVLPGCRQEPIETGAPDSTGTYNILPAKSSGGIGKVYMGREIAEVLGHPSATWMERPTREAEELPNRLVAALNIKPTDVIADIGAGTGYFTFRLCRRVPQGQVYAVDIEQEMLDMITKRKQSSKVQNVTTVLGTERDPKLPDASVDLALIVDAYHEFAYPREMMENITQALKPGGRLVLVEYRGEDATLPIDPLHRMTEAQARKEMRVVGLEWMETKSILPQQHVLIFVKPAP